MTLPVKNKMEATSLDVSIHFSTHSFANPDMLCPPDALIKQGVTDMGVLQPSFWPINRSPSTSTEISRFYMLRHSQP